MATKYLIAAGGNTSSSGSWSNVSSASAGGDGVPTASDDIRFDSGSGNPTINAALVGRSIDWTGFTGTVTHNAFTGTIGTSTAGPSNVAFKMVSGMTYTKSSTTTSAWSFTSTSATQQTITTAGKVLGNVTFNASSNGSWQLQDNLAANGATGTTLNVTKGSLDVNGYQLDLGIFNSSNSNVRSITNVGNVNLSGAAGWVLTTTTNLTFSIASVSRIYMTANGATFAGGSQTYDSVFLDAATGTKTITGNNTFNEFISYGGANKTCELVLSGDQVITGTGVGVGLLLAGDSNVNRVLLRSNQLGTQRTLTANKIVSAPQRLDFKDIDAAGSASWNLSAVGGGAGDCGGNSGITFSTPRTINTTTGTASFTWSTYASWPSGLVPLPQDDVNVNNAFVAGRTVTMDMPRSGGNISFAGCTGTPIVAMSATNSIFGSLDLTGTNSITGATVTTFEGRGNYTLTTAGKTLPKNINTSAVGGKLTFADTITTSVGLTLAFGELDTNSQAVNITGNSGFNISGTNTRTLTLGGSIVTLSGSLTVWDATTTTGLTLNAGTSDIRITATDASQKSFVGGGLNYPLVTVSGDNVVINGTGTGFDVLNINTAGLATGLKFISGGSYPIGTITTNGSSGNLAKVLAVTPGSPATIVKVGGGNFVTDWMSIKDITLSTTGSPNWFAGNNSVNVSGNTNITFTDPPGGGGSYSLTGAVGSFAFTGIAAALTRQLLLSASAGTCILTASSAQLKLGHKSTASAGSFLLSGVAANFSKTSAIAGATGVFTETANAAGLKSTRLLPSATGSFSLTGSAASFLRGFSVSSSAGSFTLNGSAANFRFSRLMAAATGAFVLIGNDAGLSNEAALLGGTGAFILSANAAGLRSTRLLIASAGGFTLTDTPAALLRGRTLGSDHGTFTLSGSAATLLAARRLTGGIGEYTLTNGNALLNRGRLLSAAAGSFVLSESAAAFLRTCIVTGQRGDFVLVGNSAGLRNARLITATAGSLTLTDNPALLVIQRSVAGNVGIYSLDGLPVSLRLDRRLDSETGEFLLLVNDAMLFQAIILRDGHFERLGFSYRGGKALEANRLGYLRTGIS